MAALAEYDARGRIYHGPQDRVFDDAVDAVPERLPGRPGGPADGHVERDRGPAGRAWCASGWSSSAGSARPRSRSRTEPAGRGDLVRARLNTRIDADGQTLANRDVVRVESITDSGFGRLAAVRRQTGPDQWSRPFFVPVAYLQSDGELAYAGNVHVAQGRTVDRGHLVVDGGA